MLVVGGLHMDDFEWASGLYEDAGYVLVCFEMDFDGYHWRAVYVKANLIEKNYRGGGVSSAVSLCRCIRPSEVKRL
jgi:hypothetical protein